MKPLLSLVLFVLWVLAFPAVAFGEAALSFEEAVSQAVKKIEEVQSKESELRSAEIARTQSQMRFLPDLSLSGTYAEAGKEFSGPHGITRSYGLRSNWNLFRFGGDYYNYKASDLQTSSLKWDLKNTKIKMEESIAGKALDYVASHLETEIRKKVTLAQKNYFSIAEKRYGKGILSRQELDQITIDLRNAEARLTDAELAEFQAAENLKIYLGTAEVTPQWPWLGQFRKINKKALKFDFKTHPEWQYLENRVAAADAIKDSRFSEILPSVDFSLSYANENLPATGNTWNTQWLGGLTLTIPLFSRLENYTVYRQAAETKIRSDLDLQRSSRDLTAQWKVSENDFRAQLESALVREQTLKISNNLYQDNLRRFQAGRSTANDLLNDQERLCQSELLAIQGWKAVHNSYIKLCHSLGQLVTECRL